MRILKSDLSKRLKYFLELLFGVTSILVEKWADLVALAWIQIQPKENLFLNVVEVFGA